MTNDALIEELAKAAYTAFNDAGRRLADWDHGTDDAAKVFWRASVRAVLSRLAELGSSSEMDLAVASAVRYLEPGEWDAAFTASLRALAATLPEGER